jgi:putative transposase
VNEGNRKRVGKKGAGRARRQLRPMARAIESLFGEQAGPLLPVLQLLLNTKHTVDEVLAEGGRAMVELLLRISAAQLAGVPRRGKRSGEVLWYGSQAGRIVLGERKLKLLRPRLRARQGAEVPIPLYERLKDDARLGSRMSEIVLAGVSTRRYGRVLPELADAAGMSRSEVSRELIQASESALAALMERSFHEIDLLAVWIDGIEIAGHHVLAAVGLDDGGKKHLLGLVAGSSENAQVVKDLLSSLVARGIDAAKRRLFVIDGSKALRSGIREIYGQAALIQRCRTHKVRNVLERLPEARLAAQVKAVMHAAYKLEAQDGIAKLRQQAAWLKREHKDAAASLLEGLEESFTVNALGLPPALVRCLATTNLIESPNRRVREVTGKVSRWRDADMVLRWSALGFLEAEKSFRRIQGHRQLWILETALRGANAQALAKAA